MRFACPGLARLVAESGLSERTFKRGFLTATGCPPVESVQMIRIEAAKRPLETTGGRPIWSRSASATGTPPSSGVCSSAAPTSPLRVVGSGSK
jgi:AraC-like DNA-binding protein